MRKTVTRTEKCGGTITFRIGQHTAETSLHTRSYKHIQHGKGQKSKDSTIVRVAAKLERIESTMFAVSHRAKCDERRENRRAERIAFREKKRAAK
jgi:hypothetical protein